MPSLTNLLRSGKERDAVTNLELFFDLVFVFAVTQLSTRLLARPTAAGALEGALLLGMVWLAWMYTTWVTNWLDPARMPVRLMLFAIMLAGLVLSAGLPDAFSGRGEWVGGAYAAIQIGRSAFAVAALGPGSLRANFQRLLAWCSASGALAVGGGLVVDRPLRAGLWAGAVAVDLLGGVVGFWTPGLGRSVTTDWTISGSHLAERCQAFVLIALGESVVRIGATFSDAGQQHVATVLGFGAAFVGVASLWWVYFDRSAEEAAREVQRSSDPGRLGRSAYHFVHPVMVAGIIATAAADQHVLAHPAATAHAETAWLVLGGTGLYLAGHAAFKKIIWGVVSWSRVTAVVALALAGLGTGSMSNLALGCLAGLVVVAVAVADRLLAPVAEPEASPA